MRLLLLFMIFGFNLQAQDLPTEPADGFAFPLGSKFTIKMEPADSLNYNFSVVAFEPFQEIVELFEGETLFEENREDGTIDFYFCLGTRGETEQEREENMKVLLIMKNHTNQSFTYESDIQMEEDGEFESTTNVGTHPGVVTTEMWHHMIYYIGLHGFQLGEY